MNPKQSLFLEEWLLQKGHLKTNLLITDIFIVISFPDLVHSQHSKAVNNTIHASFTCCSAGTVLINQWQTQKPLQQNLTKIPVCTFMWDKNFHFDRLWA